VKGIELMEEIKHGHHRHEGGEGELVTHETPPYWKRVHHDWRVWVALFFCLAAITIYVLSNDLSFFPGGQRVPPPAAARGG
jgi:hypothetical protein